MLVGIGLMGFHIGYTAKTGSTDYFFLIPVGISVMLIGMLLRFRRVFQQKQGPKEGEE